MPDPTDTCRRRDCAVPIATAAAALESTTEAVTAAAAVLRDRLAPAGLVLSIRVLTMTLVPDRGALGDAAVRRLLRIDDVRGGLSAPVARTLHRVARAARPQQNADERARVAALLRGGWVTPVAGASGVRTRVELHPDVRFSLALDDGFRCRPAGATLHGNRLQPDLPTDPDDVPGTAG
jgi:hypothetical protein